MRACVLTQESEEAPASSASLLAMPMGRSQEERDHCLEAVLRRLQEVGLTLNEKKCEFSRPSVKFLGQIVDQSGGQIQTKSLNALSCGSSQHHWFFLDNKSRRGFVLSARCLENFPSWSVMSKKWRTSPMHEGVRRFKIAEKSKKRLAEVQYLLFF